MFLFIYIIFTFLFCGWLCMMMFACLKNVEEEVEAFKEARKYVCWFFSFTFYK